LINSGGSEEGEQVVEVASGWVFKGCGSSKRHNKSTEAYR
jgi:hypothetical protein